MSNSDMDSDTELLSDINMIQNLPLNAIPEEPVPLLKTSVNSGHSSHSTQRCQFQAPYKFRDREIMSKFARSDNDFKDCFRMSKKAVENLCEKG